MFDNRLTKDMSAVNRPPSLPHSRYANGNPAGAMLMAGVDQDY